MAYQPDEDPFLVEEEASEVGSIAPPPPKTKKNSRSSQQPNQPPTGNYQYQPQSMYNIPNGAGPPPGQFPGQAPPRGLQSTPSFMINGQPGPMMRPAPSFYVDPSTQPPYVMLPPPQPYGMPPPPMAYGPPPAVYIQPPPVYPAAMGGYRDHTTLSEQISELERYQRSRPHNYDNNPADNSLLIATLVSEQDALYGTNMLENITPMDQEYITSLMQRGVPEHEALRMAFDRKPHTLVPPKVASRVVDTDADKHALEQAIQLSLTESSRRASQPDRPAMGLGAASTDRVDQEALEKAIQLSLSEQQGRQAYRADSAGYSAHANIGYAESSQYASSQYNSQQTSHHHRAGSGSHGYIAGGAGTYRDDASHSGSEYSYHSEDPRGRGGYAPAPETFDRQYPYNLGREAPVEVLKKNYAVSGVDKYRLAQQQQQEYFDHLQSETARSHVAGGSHASSHGGGGGGGGSRAEYTTRTEEYTERRGDYDEYSEHHRGAARGAEDLRARAYGSHAQVPSSYRESPSSLSPVPDYRPAGGYDRQYPYNMSQEQRMPPPGYDGPQYDEYSGSSRSRSDSGGEEPYDGPVQYTHEQRAQYNRGGGGYGRSEYEQAEYAQEERREEYRRQEYAPPQQPAYPDAYPPSSRVNAGRPQPPARQPYGLSPPPAYGNGDDSDEEGKMDPPPRMQNTRGNYSGASSAYSERVETNTTAAAPTFQRTLERAPSARDLRPPQRDDVPESSYGRSTMQSAAPPMMDAGGASRFQSERERFLQQTQQMQMQQQRTAQQTTRTSTVTSQQQAHSEYTSSRQPPGYGGAGGGGMRGPTRGIAAADMDEPPPEFAEDEDGQPQQKHEWRNTLKRLVNNLTEPSDEED